MNEAPDVDSTVHKLESLLEEIGQADPQLRDRTENAIRLLMQLYGAGLARTIEILGPEAADRLTGDRLTSSLLLLHGLHPEDAATRVGQALRRVERGLDGHRLLLTEIAGDIARIRVEPNGGPLPHSLAAIIERSIAECAPDVAKVEIEGIPEPAPVLIQIGAMVPNAPG